MGKKKVRKISIRDIVEITIRYLQDISFGSADFFENKRRKEIRTFSKKIIKFFKTQKEVEEYLGFVLNEMDDLNAFFRKKKRAAIPYSKLLSFANKDERISSFLFQKKVELKRPKKKDELEIAGTNSLEEKENFLDSLFVFFEGADYKFLIAKNGFLFFFSVEKRRLIVQIPSGKIVSYKEYRRQFFREKDLKFASKISLFREIRDNKEKNDIMIAFMIYIRQLRVKLARKIRNS